VQRTCPGHRLANHAAGDRAYRWLRLTWAALIRSNAIVQMPRGVPVATVAINSAYNAGLLAVQILSLRNKALQEELSRYRQELAARVGGAGSPPTPGRWRGWGFSGEQSRR